MRNPSYPHPHPCAASSIFLTSLLEEESQPAPFVFLRMVRYVANVVVDGRTTRFAVILPESAQVSALRDKLKDRLYEFRLGSQEESLVLHLDAVDGPILDPEDLLSDVLPDPKAEELFAVLGKGILGTTAEVRDTRWSYCVPQAYMCLQTQNGQATQPAAPREHASSKSFKVRIITPELARSHADVNLIPPISEDKVSSNSSLILLKARVKEHLGLPYSLDPCDDMECNCAFAHQIDQNTALNELGSGASDAMKTLLVVYGNNKVTRVIVEHTTRKSLEDAAREHLRDHISGKIMSTVGGVATRNGPGNEKNYVKLPVIAFCAPISHDDFEKPVRTRTSAYRPQRKLEVDLHTSEAPIEITGSNAQLTLLDAGLDDCTINGVLNIYAVKRLAPSCITDNNVDKGKDAIFRNEDLAWEHPLGQSERGLANLLSTLRVFANNTGAREMEPFQQDKILHLIYVLTRFPPAVRAAHVLMQGKTPTISERAALGQCIYEVLKMIVPLPVIKHDFTRLFEGSRLLFGLIFEKARNLKTSSSEQEGLTYIDSMKVYDLRNMITMEPVGTPVQTVWGLVDQGFQDAFKPEGLLQWTNGTEIIALSSIDQKLQRIALLSGGAKSQVAIFDIDAVNRSPRYAMDINHIIAPSEYSDLQYLATLCSRNKLGVLVPSSLPSAEPPVLTLDRQGHLAVYVGRQSCARPGRDITMFRPANSSAEETVDVSIITQLLVPILDRRNADGTAVFEAFGDQHRRLKDPDEVLILCMDCSSSMDDRCGFIDVEENEDAADPVLENINSSYRWSESMEDRRFDRPALNEMKAYLVEHESFGDMLAIVRSGTYNVNRQDHAEWILKILRILAEKEAEHMAEELENTRRRATSYFYRQKAERMEGELATLKNRSIRLQQYSEALSTFLLYRADNTSAETSEPLTWTVGSEIPKVRKTSSISQDDLDFNVPAEYLCPISAEIMEDPVTTVDNFTYERKNIERWFQTHSTSPCTNLVLTGFDLTPNFAVKRQIEDWTTGSDIISKYQIRRSNQISMTLKSPLSSWTLTLPQDITLLDLYHIAWRQTKGRYQEFELHHRDKMLKPSTEQARSYIKSNQDVFISPYAAVRGQSSTTDEHEELCLVKVYVNQYYLNFISYWEPKKTTKTLASTVFRYYREWFRLESRLPDQESFTLWTNLVHQGDGHYRGIVSNYWESLSYFFDREHARGKLEREPCYESTEEEGSMGTGNGPLVFKIFLGRRPVVDERHKPLTRMDVLKQMFDAYINRLLAYNFQTHIGLVTFRSTASLTQVRNIEYFFCLVSVRMANSALIKVCVTASTLSSGCLPFHNLVLVSPRFKLTVGRESLMQWKTSAISSTIRPPQEIQRFGMPLRFPAINWWSIRRSFPTQSCV